MSINSIGDMSQYFLSMRSTGAIKNQLKVLTQEMASGDVNDLTMKLNGNLEKFLDIDREISVLETYRQTTNELSLMMGMMQTSLDAIEQIRGSQANQNISVTTGSLGPIVESVAKSSFDSFQEMASALNKSFGGVSLFAGTRTDGLAIAEADTMLDEIVSGLPTGANFDQIVSVVDDWFTGPSGGFYTNGYLGEPDGTIERKTGPNTSIELSVTAEHEGLTSVLKAAALGALAHHARGQLAFETQVELINKSGVDLISSSATLNSMRADLGTSEALVDEHREGHEVQLASLGILRNEVARADPYETAVRLQEMQQQLEIQFSITARMSGLSLANYL